MSLTLRRHLWVAFGIVLAMLLLVGAAGAVAVHTTAVDTRRATDEVAPGLQANADVLNAVADVDAALRGYVISADPAYLRPYHRSLDRLQVTLSRLDKVLTDTRGDRVLAAQRHAITTWRRQYALPRVDMPVGPDNINQRLLRRNLRLQADIRAANASVRVHLRSRLDDLAARADRARVAVTVGVAVLALLAMAVGAATSIRTIRRVRQPLAELRDVLGQLASGHHVARVRPGGPQEIATIGQRVNALADETDRLRAVEAEERRLQERLVAFSRSARGRRDDRDIMMLGMTELGTALGLRRAYLRMVEDGSARGIEAEWHAPGLAPLPDTINLSTPGPVDDLEDLLQRSHARVTPDVSTGPAYTSERGRAWARLVGAGSTMAVPVHVGTEPIAVVSLIDGAPREWTSAEVRLAESVATDLGRALADARLYATQTEALNRLQALDKAKDDFVSGVTHELRTPLTSIGGYLELLEDEAVGVNDQSSGARRQALGVLRRNVDRLGGLIDDLLALSRVESGVFRTTHADVDLTEVVHMILEDMRRQAHAQGVELDARVPESAVVRGDENQLCRALLNLVSNGVKFTPPGGAVTVTVEPTPDGFRVSVTDTGMGIPAAEQEQLSQRFFRASNAIEAGVPGTGLGLAIVRTIAENHAGSVDIDSVEGSGTTVVLRLPGNADAATDVVRG